MTQSANQQGVAWYKQFWPWFLLGLPLIVVVAALFTLFIALNTTDTVVAEDYYKEGLAVNTNLARDKRAKELGLQAKLHIEGDKVVVQIDSTQPDMWSVYAQQPLQLQLENLSFAKRDVSVVLTPMTKTLNNVGEPNLWQGVWHGGLPEQASWNVRLVGADWRINQRLDDVRLQTVSLQP